MKTHPFPQQLLGLQLILSTSIWILEKTSEIEKSTQFNGGFGVKYLQFKYTSLYINNGIHGLLGTIVKWLCELRGTQKYQLRMKEGFFPSYTRQQDVSGTIRWDCYNSG